MLLNKPDFEVVYCCHRIVRHLKVLQMFAQRVAHVSLIIPCTLSESYLGNSELSMCNAFISSCTLCSHSSTQLRTGSQLPEASPRCEHVSPTGSEVCVQSRNATFSQLALCLGYQLLAYSSTPVNTTDNVMSSSSGSGTSII